MRTAATRRLLEGMDELKPLADVEASGEP